jgi:mxaJ protein
MAVIPDNNTRSDGQPLPHHYSTSIGVRKGEEKLLKAINTALAKRSPDVQALLAAEGIPLLPLDEPNKTALLDH